MECQCEVLFGFFVFIVPSYLPLLVPTGHLQPFLAILRDSSKVIMSPKPVPQNPSMTPKLPQAPPISPNTSKPPQLCPPFACSSDYHSSLVSGLAPTAILRKLRKFQETTSPAKTFHHLSNKTREKANSLKTLKIKRPLFINYPFLPSPFCSFSVYFPCGLLQPRLHSPLQISN